MGAAGAGAIQSLYQPARALGGQGRTRVPHRLRLSAPRNAASTQTADATNRNGQGDRRSVSIPQYAKSGNTIAARVKFRSWQLDTLVDALKRNCDAQCLDLNSRVGTFGDHWVSWKSVRASYPAPGFGLALCKH